MDNLWLLSEERPKPSVILQIVKKYCEDFNDQVTARSEIKIRPQIENGFFKFTYEVEGLEVGKANKVLIKIVSGSSSFLDFLLFKQENAPTEGCSDNNLLMAIEETKTSDTESRNTGVYQRGSKFVYIRHYYKNVKLYMLYNEELADSKSKKPSDTNVFGTNILLTLGVCIIGKDTSRWFKPFESLDELIQFKEKMRRPPAGNVPMLIRKVDTNHIEISGRLSKPSDAGNIAHDPNIGALSMISSCIRELGWSGSIVITEHGVSQKYIDRTAGNNKFLYISNILGLYLKDITMPENITLPELYWHYEKNSEKIATILLHLQTVYHGMLCVYENHAGCERGYFRTNDEELIALPKRDSCGENLYLPDVVLYNRDSNCILIVEGKKLSNLQQGIEELERFNSIEREYISLHYQGATIIRWVSIFGGNLLQIPNEMVLFYLADNGRIIINEEAPEFIKEAFNETGTTT